MSRKKEIKSAYNRAYETILKESTEWQIGKYVERNDGDRNCNCANICLEKL